MHGNFAKAHHGLRHRSIEPQAFEVITEVVLRRTRAFVVAHIVHPRPNAPIGRSSLVPSNDDLRPYSTASRTRTIEMATDGVPCGPDPAPVLEQVRTWERAGFDRIAIHQVGPDQDGFFRFWEQELQPELG